MKPTLAVPLVAVKRKRDNKMKRDPLSSSAPRQVMPYTKRMKAKKQIFRMFYQAVKKKGGRYRHMIETGSDSLSQDLLVLLDEQLKLYVCLTSMIIQRDTYGNTVLGPDGKPKKISVKEVCLPSLKESIITKCCYEVKEKFIVSFF
jgi:hypothetical protein